MIASLVTDGLLSGSLVTGGLGTPGTPTGGSGLLLESGFSALLESGFTLLEEGGAVDVTTCISLEGGFHLLLEDESGCLTVEGIPAAGFLTYADPRQGIFVDIDGPAQIDPRQGFVLSSNN